jgi:hypothetical protein
MAARSHLFGWMYKWEELFSNECVGELPAEGVTQHKVILRT